MSSAIVLCFVLVTFSLALPVQRETIIHRRRPEMEREWDRPARRFNKHEEIVEPWIPNGVPGHIDLMASGPSNRSTATSLYTPYITIQSIPTGQTPYKVGEIGYSGPSTLISLNAMPFGRGTKFWILKSHDVDCFAGSEFASSYNASSQSGGTEYPVTLRSPLKTSKGGGIIAYCATYDPNPRGSGMTLGAAPCGTISCASLPQPEPGAESLPSLSRNPDGTLAPVFFTTRPCNYLDPNCHVSQIFLYSAETGAVRPMYHTGGMEGVNSTWISSGQPRRRNVPEPLVRSVNMVFRQGDTRVLPGWPDPDPALVLSHPAFDVHDVSQAPTPNATLDSSQLEVPGMEPGTMLHWATRVNLLSSTASEHKDATPTLNCSIGSVAQQSIYPTPATYLVWLAPPIGTLH